MSEWFRANSSGFTGQIFFGEPLSRHTYYRIGGPAQVLAIPKGLDDLKWLSRAVSEAGIPYFFLGAGSNLLASDEGFQGLVIKTGRLNLEMTLLPDHRLRLGASVAISTLLRRASQDGWSGRESWSGIPGSVGGAIFMNAGTHLGETKDDLLRVEAFSLKSGEVITYEGEQLRFEYRKNLFLPQDSVVWTGEWAIRLEDPAEVKATIDETLARRKATQPVEFPSCGSVFKNPRDHGMHSWQVIEKLGLRGHRIGSAEFSKKHCNFIVNLGGAKASDVRGLIDLVKSRAQSELGIRLEEEVKYLGPF